MENCTLLVNSCDNYYDCWDGFFELLKIQWPTFNLPTVLNTETREYHFDGIDIKTFCLCKNRKMEWGGRLKETLKRINTKYVLFCLEDFYLTDKVDTEMLDKCYRYMEENDNIACFSFLPAGEDNIPSEKYLGFEKRTQNGEYRLNCQFALWRKDLLIKYIRNHENPWEWEIYGSKRSSRYNEEFYAVSKNIKSPFCYENGGVTMRGRWYKSRVQPLIDKYGISVDLSTRQSYEEYVSLPQKHERKIIRGIKNRIHKLLSLI